MKLKRIIGSATAAALLAIGGVVATTQQAAAADMSPMGRALCSNTTRCGLDVPVSVTLTPPTAGQKFAVNVTGQKGKPVTVQAWAIVWIDDNNYKAAPISNAVTVTPTGSSSVSYGHIQTQLTAITPKAGFHGANVTIQPSDWRPGMALVPSSWIQGQPDSGKKASDFNIFTARAQDLGFVEKTFQGTFTRKADAGIPGDKYSVQVLLNGKWTTIDYSGPGTVARRGTLTVMAKVPALAPGRYRTRLINVTRKIYDVSPDQPYTYFRITRQPQPGEPGFDVYTQPGTWTVNGRQWRTRCEKYSSTERCFTDISATQVIYKNGRFSRVTGWVFNNLTYKPSPRSNWTKNALGGYGKVGFKGTWKGSDGRSWRTECDTAATGRGGCRSYAMTSVAEEYAPGRYRVVKKYVFNNIVRFTK